jgi:AcrR family transcriptional regulator
MFKEEPLTRDSDATRKRILAAVGDLLARQGFQEIGINAVARKAGLDKVLIYRYFGGMPQLLRAFAQQGEFWPTIGQLLGRKLTEIGDMDVADLSVALLKGYLRELRKRVTTQEVLRWEVVQRNELTDELAAVREAQGLEILDLLPAADGAAGDRDLAAVGALLHAGVMYLVLRSKTADAYMGVDLQTEEGWSRIERAIESLAGACFHGRS